MEEPIKTLAIDDPDYPSMLKRITRPPAVLYYQGEKPEEEKALAIVGTRKCSGYGKTAAFSIARDLADQGIIVISGLARGIDRAAHKGSLAEGGKTIAVLGTGLDQASFYPKENTDLRKAILENKGTLLSEYPVGTKGSRFTFPERNRLISGLTIATVVIEGNLRSGAMITAKWALSQGKKIFALPGPVESLNSKGPHYLIKKGAHLIENADDVLEHLEIKKIRKKEENKKETANNKIEILIIRVLEREPLPLDKIIEKINMPSNTVSAALSIMELSGRVKHIGGNRYSL
jgi:DNA processing protein